MKFQVNDEKPIIAVTGSAGKTTVKTIISSILREKWIIFESKDYYNTTDKTELHANLINYMHRAAVLEYGMAYPGVLTMHCQILRPNIGIITNVGLSHIGNFQNDIVKLSAAKSELIKGMHPNGMLLINADDENSKLLHTGEFKGTIVTIGIENEADYTARQVCFKEEGMSFVVNLLGTEYNFTVPMLGRHNVYNALFAIAVADQLGFNPKEIQSGLLHMKSPNHRLNLYKKRNGITLIDDTVHAYPASMRAALDVLAEIAKGKKIAILGSMTELGDKINDYHKEIGRYLVSKNIDFLFTYGNVSAYIGEGAIEAGLPAENVKHYKCNYRKELYNDLLKTIEDGSTILIKGVSQLKMYDILQYLSKFYE